LNDEIARLATQGIRPGLAAVLVGDNPASQLYVKSKIAACEQLGIASWLHAPSLPSLRKKCLTSSTNSIAMTTSTASSSSFLSPRKWTPRKFWKRLTPQRTWMVFIHEFGKTRQRPRRTRRLHTRRLHGNSPAQSNSIEGANAVVLGRSDIVGKPMALLLMHANATVTICHSKTRDLPDVVRRADIVVAAMGKAGYVKQTGSSPAPPSLTLARTKLPTSSKPKSS